jgi:hypothetical protein
LQQQGKEITLLKKHISVLEEKLSGYAHPKNSSNNSLPPSQDPFRSKRTMSLRGKSGKKRRGQAGHERGVRFYDKVMHFFAQIIIYSNSPVSLNVCFANHFSGVAALTNSSLSIPFSIKIPHWRLYTNTHSQLGSISVILQKAFTITVIPLDKKILIGFFTYFEIQFNLGVELSEFISGIDDYRRPKFICINFF